MTIYGLKKDNGFVIYDTETKKIIKRYAPNSFPKEIIQYFRSVNSKIDNKKICGVSRKEKQMLEEIIKTDSIKI